MSDGSSRPPKRARQACEGCRRKKTRCPGEQPACSLCVRLGQICSYDNGSRALDPDQTVSERLRSLESKMDMMLSGQFAFPPKHVMDKFMMLYDERCNYQPLPLFGADFAGTYEFRDQELLNAVLAIAIQLPSRPDTAFVTESPTEYAKKASDSVTKKLGNGGVGLSTIQTLCLLSFWEFADGQKDRSWLHLDLALWLAQHSKLTEEPAWNVPPVELEERRRCAWSLYILGRMTGSSPKLPIVTCRFPGATASLLHSPESPVSEGEIIISNNIKLYDILEKVQHFAAQSNCEAGKSLWTGDSEYGSIVSALMEYESQFPDEHRFSEHTSGNFKDDRAYWAPWFSIQFMYHAILCILNHPFLLAIRLEPIKESSPRTFKQTTADLAKLHSYWAFRFTSVAKEFGYAVTDPLIAYAVTVAATIFDHYRLSPETQARRDARDKFIKCLAFVREIGKVWPIAAQMVRPLILVAYPF
ncbi:hypothetical protein B0J12DRAFT_738082 [Macrophomina phaseolina]|uniref:Zn(2)-C6 fungal-type domain-containing protein n=1 Tax=Macrophomina phaseolina TaxID=35725 RepID=A0ABQ8GLR1_9PEZI|nr:hypothetical protein B0J12DRAFT_738082 [Macrophomina phaseolina]